MASKGLHCPCLTLLLATLVTAQYSGDTSLSSQTIASSVTISNATTSVSLTSVTISGDLLITGLSTITIALNTVTVTGSVSIRNPVTQLTSTGLIANGGVNVASPWTSASATFNHLTTPSVTFSADVISTRIILTDATMSRTAAPNLDASAVLFSRAFRESALIIDSSRLSASSPSTQCSCTMTAVRFDGMVNFTTGTAPTTATTATGETGVLIHNTYATLHTVAGCPYGDLNGCASILIYFTSPASIVGDHIVVTSTTMDLVGFRLVGMVIGSGVVVSTSLPDMQSTSNVWSITCITYATFVGVNMLSNVGAVYSGVLPWATIQGFARRLVVASIVSHSSLSFTNFTVNGTLILADKGFIASKITASSTTVIASTTGSDGAIVRTTGVFMDSTVVITQSNFYISNSDSCTFNFGLLDLSGPWSQASNVSVTSSVIRAATLSNCPYGDAVGTQATMIRVGTTPATWDLAKGLILTDSDIAITASSWGIVLDIQGTVRGSFDSRTLTSNRVTITSRGQPIAFVRVVNMTDMTFVPDCAALNGAPLMSYDSWSHGQNGFIIVTNVVSNSVIGFHSCNLSAGILVVGGASTNVVVSVTDTVVRSTASTSVAALSMPQQFNTSVTLLRTMITVWTYVDCGTDGVNENGLATSVRFGQIYVDALSSLVMQYCNVTVRALSNCPYGQANGPRVVGIDVNATNLASIETDHNNFTLSAAGPLHGFRVLGSLTKVDLSPLINTSTFLFQNVGVSSYVGLVTVAGDCNGCLLRLDGRLTKCVPNGTAVYGDQAHVLRVQGRLSNSFVDFRYIVTSMGFVLVVQNVTSTVIVARNSTFTPSSYTNLYLAYFGARLQKTSVALRAVVVRVTAYHSCTYEAGVFLLKGAADTDTSLELGDCNIIVNTPGGCPYGVQNGPRPTLISIAGPAMQFDDNTLILAGSNSVALQSLGGTAIGISAAQLQGEFSDAGLHQILSLSAGYTQVYVMIGTWWSPTGTLSLSSRFLSSLTASSYVLWVATMVGGTVTLSNFNAVGGLIHVNTMQQATLTITDVTSQMNFDGQGYLWNAIFVSSMAQQSKVILQRSVLRATYTQANCLTQSNPVIIFQSVQSGSVVLIANSALSLDTFPIIDTCQPYGLPPVGGPTVGFTAVGSGAAVELSQVQLLANASLKTVAATIAITVGQIDSAVFSVYQSTASANTFLNVDTMTGSSTAAVRLVNNTLVGAWLPVAKRGTVALLSTTTFSPTSTDYGTTALGDNRILSYATAASDPSPPLTKLVTVAAQSSTLTATSALLLRCNVVDTGVPSTDTLPSPYSGQVTACSSPCSLAYDCNATSAVSVSGTAPLCVCQCPPIPKALVGRLHYDARCNPTSRFMTPSRRITPSSSVALTQSRELPQTVTHTYVPPPPTRTRTLIPPTTAAPTTTAIPSTTALTPNTSSAPLTPIVETSSMAPATVPPRERSVTMEMIVTPRATALPTTLPPVNTTPSPPAVPIVVTSISSSLRAVLNPTAAQAVSSGSSTAAAVGGAASPTSATKAANIANIVSGADCSFSPDSLQVDPMQVIIAWNIGHSDFAPLEGPIMSTLIFVALGHGAIWALHYKWPTYKGTRKAVGLITTVLAGYLLPTTMGFASTVLFHAPTLLERALFGGGGVILTVAIGLWPLPWFYRTLRGCPRKRGKVHWPSSETRLYGYRPFYDLARSAKEVGSLLCYFEDLGCALALAFMSSAQVDGVACIMPSAIIAVLSLLHCVYLGYVRPFRTKLDALFSYTIGAAQLIAAVLVAGSTLTTVSTSLLAYVTLMLSFTFMAQTATLLVWMCVLKVRRLRRAAHHKGKTSTSGEKGGDHSDADQGEDEEEEEPAEPILGLPVQSDDGDTDALKTVASPSPDPIAQPLLPMPPSRPRPAYLDRTTDDPPPQGVEADPAVMNPLQKRLLLP